MSYLKDKKIVIATMHKKEKVIGQFFKEAFGVETFVPQSYNTDIFGTFTRDVKRAGTQLEAARKKALMALESTGADIAVASEGSFLPHTILPGVTSNKEIVILVDKKNSIEVHGEASSLETNFNQKEVSSKEEAMAFAASIGFPDHGIIVRKHTTAKEIYKEITTWEELEKVVSSLLRGFFTKSIFLETDMRAHRNPTRMKVISDATRNLISRVQVTCPNCATIGYSKTSVSKNALCSLCGLTTDMPGSYIYECQKCLMSEEKKEVDSVDPKDCSYCNV